jgi:hypothetical protein
LFFEPISPRFISFLLRRRLGEWEREGLIAGSKTKIRRIGKFHYRVEVDLDLTQKQANRMLTATMARILKKVKEVM